MKIWLVITDNDGGVNPEAFADEGTAAVRFQELVEESWARHLPGEVWPDNADDAYVRLCDLPGFEDYVSMREVDVADPPITAPVPVIERLRPFNLVLAVSIRAYGSVTVDARSMAEALEIVRAEAETGQDTDGDPCWSYCTDVEWSSECEHAIISAEDGDTGDVFPGIDLTPPDDPNKIISAEELALRITEATA